MITFFRAIRLPRSVALFFTLAGFWLPAQGQENAPGPLAPPPDHDVKRIVGVPQPEAPPSLPPRGNHQGFFGKGAALRRDATAILVSQNHPYSGTGLRRKSYGRICCHV